jgi:pyrimidine-nucleoside phosphorylase
MLTASLIAKKRDGNELSDDEIQFLIDGFCKGTVADYQMSAFAMAVCLRGMSQAETASLTQVMWRSGQSAQRQSDVPRVDKHSTGGLGDKISIVLAPLLATCDVHVPMISGRGLGLTGGTLDKLESIPGFRTNFDLDDAERLLTATRCYIISAGPDIAPADRRLYALRDVTGTVESVPLITASILSKKLSASLDALVMDVKVGSGAFMKTKTQAETLARSLIDVGRAAGLPTQALLTDMDQPLGEAIGNAIEINEAVEVLQGGGPNDVAELTIELSAMALVAVRDSTSLDEARALLRQKLASGEAFQAFETMVAAQGGWWTGPLSLAQEFDIFPKQSGFVQEIDCRAIGEAIVALGGGRQRAGDAIDHSVGIRLFASVGGAVDTNTPIMRVYATSERRSEYVDRLVQAIRVSSSPTSTRPLVLARVE